MGTPLDTVRTAWAAMPACKDLQLKSLAEMSSPRDPEIDAILTVSLRGQTFTFRVCIKHHLHRAAIERIVALRNTEDRSRGWMLVSDHITTAQAEILRKHDVTFLDSTGNVFMELPGLHLFVVGKPKAIAVEKASPDRIFHRTGMQLIFAFLADPDLDRKLDEALLNKSFREIRSRTGVALGSIGTVLDCLEEYGYIVTHENLRLLVNRRQLFEKWVAAYMDRLRPKLVTHRLRSRGDQWWKTIPSLGVGNYWGGEVAGAKLTGYLEAELVSIYSRGDIQQLILDADLRLDPGGDVEVLRVFWGEQEYYEHVDSIHPLLVYADLMASEIDRNMDTAKRVYERYLRQTIESGG